jgi:hypothetical protein
VEESTINKVLISFIHFTFQKYFWCWIVTQSLYLSSFSIIQTKQIFHFC